MRNKILEIIILVFIFTISLLIRAPYISNEMRCWNNPYMQTLICLENWNNQGIENYHYSPIQTYNNIGDKFNSDYPHLIDKSGDDYYVSFPPLTFIIAHYYFKIININPSRIVLQYFNLFLHLVSALFLYFLIKRIINFNSDNISLIAIIGYSLYVLMPIMLYLHSEIYFPEMFSQVLWIISAYYFYNFISYKRHIYLYISLLFTLLVCYTEWLGYFYALSIILYFYFNRNKHLFYKKYIFITLIIMLSSLILLIFQYSQINGFTDLIRSLSIRFVERSGYFGETFSDRGIHIFNLNSHLILFKNINNMLFPLGYLMIIIIIISLLKKKSIIRNINVKSIIFYLFILPVILHITLIFNTNALHFMNMARLVIPLIIITTIVLSKNDFLSKKLNKLIVFILIITGTIIGFDIYKNEAIYGHNDEDILVSHSNFIKENAKNDETIFIKNNCECLLSANYLTFNTKRNIRIVNNLLEANNFFNNNLITKKGIFIDFTVYPYKIEKFIK